MLTMNSGAERAKSMHTVYVQRMYDTKWVNDILCPGIGSSFIFFYFASVFRKEKPNKKKTRLRNGIVKRKTETLKCFSLLKRQLNR